MSSETIAGFTVPPMNSKQKYKKLCEDEKTIPIFSKDWWLDATAGEDNWDVVIVEENGRVVTTFPYSSGKRYLFRLITMPPLTQKLGPWIKYPEGLTHYDRLAFEKKVMTRIIDRLPEFDWFLQSFDYAITNWLPFCWRGFSQTTRYTYVIEDLTDLDSVLRDFEYSKRKNIKRAEKIVEVKFDLAARDFYENHKMTLAKEGKKIEYGYAVFKRIYEACYNHDSGKTIYCVDKGGNMHSALFVIWDENSSYDLISTIDPDFRDSGSASLLIKEIIKFLSDRTKNFDFEGSMIESVEQSFRRFGAVQKQYHQISKINSKLLRLYKFLKGF